MPLSKRRNRDRMRVSRATPVQPEIVQPSLDELRRTIKDIEERPPSGSQQIAQVPPIYNYQLHHPGDKVRVWQDNKWVETIVPLDDGSPFEPFNENIELARQMLPLQRSASIFKPGSFNPAPKPAKRVKVRQRRLNELR